MMSFSHKDQKQETLPSSAITFRRYLADYGLEPLEVALKAGVRYMTIWRIMQGQSINRRYELLVRRGLLHLTGIPYIAPIFIHEDPESSSPHTTGPLEDH